MAEVRQLVDMGFAEADAIRALQQVNLNLEQAVERLLGGGLGEPEPLPVQPGPRGGPDDGEAAPRTTLGPEKQGWSPEALLAETARAPEPSAPPPLPLRDAEDPDLSAALEMSMREQRDGSLAPAAPAAREAGMPCGLLNIGNTCYVNSFLQTLLHVDAFRERMLRYRAPAERPPPLAAAGGGAASSRAPPPQEPEAELEAGREAAAAAEGRREHCVGLAAELRRLFARGLLGARSCLDPSRLLGELVDQRGQKVPIGGQEDVGEFMLKLFDQLDEGLRLGSFAEAEGGGEAAPAGGGEGAAGAGAGGEGAAGDEPAPEARAAPDEGAAEAAPEAGQAPASQEAAAAPTGGEVATGASAGGEPAKPSLLQSLFFGGQVQVLSYHDGPPAGAAEPAKESEAAEEEKAAAESKGPAKEGGLVVNEEKSDFLQIFLDVKHKDIYTAWEAANLAETDYTTPSGLTTKAKTEVWIERLPKLLFFQLQRVAFDQERKAQFKLDDVFNFSSTVYVDRFLLENRARATEVARHVRELQRRHDELTEELASFEAYQGRPGLDVQEVLAWAAECLEGNAGAAEGGAEAAAGAAAPRRRHPHCLAAAEPPQPELDVPELRRGAPAAAALLRQLRGACGGAAAGLREERERLAAEVSAAWGDLRQHAYELYAIWVHSGIAGSGHYLAYLRDWRNDRWVRFDDALVSIVQWEDVRSAAIGQEGSNTSAYILVYAEKSLALEQSQPCDEAAASRLAQEALPPQLLRDIRGENEALREEQGRHEAMFAEQELKRHAGAIFQHYAGLVHQWEPLRRTADSAGNPHDHNARKHLHDPALLKFELFLYRMHGEQEVWTQLLTQSIDAQREARQWVAEDEGCVLYHLAVTLRGQKCYASMLRERQGPTKYRSECELAPMEMERLVSQYNLVLTQASIIDEALQHLRDDRGQLLACICRLAFLWANWSLEQQDKFRQNEVLLLMSTLIYNTVGLLEKGQRFSPDVSLAAFQPACEYFLLLIWAVEWPKSWKVQPIQQIQGLFPQIGASLAKQLGKDALRKDAGGLWQHPNSVAEQKEAILQHSLTRAHADLDAYELRRPEPGEAFFERHRSLYGWAMQQDEQISREYVLSQAPALRLHAGQ